MGIFSKLQIKDIKSRLLGGGKAKHKVEVPAISVIPPTPLIKTSFVLPGTSNQHSNGTIQQQVNYEKFGISQRHRSFSLPNLSYDNVEDEIDSKEVDREVGSVDFYVNSRVRSLAYRKVKKDVSLSCPEIFSKSRVSIAQNTDEICNRHIERPNSVGVHERKSPMGNNKPVQQIMKYTQAIMLEKNIDKDSNIDGNCQSNLLCDINSLQPLNSQDTAKQDVPSLYQSSGASNELISFETENSMNSNRSENVRRRPIRPYKEASGARWSLDLETILQPENHDQWSSVEDGRINWDGQSSGFSPKTNGKGSISTWSLNLKKETASPDWLVERARSEVNFGKSTLASQGADIGLPNTNFAIFNAENPNIDLVTAGEMQRNSQSLSEDNMLHMPPLKRGLTGYMGKFNGIVSKFSTWSLDVELNRKRSLDDNDLNVTNRAQSETLLDTLEPVTTQTEKSLSYHTLLYDIDEASKYQIYQPTVYEIDDEDTRDERISGRKRNIPGEKSGQYSNSMKFLSKKFENLCENSKNLYKNRYVLIDALKQREKELKTIADRLQNADKPMPTEQIFKPKLGGKQKSHSCKNER